jgi:hypothetical protein
MYSGRRPAGLRRKRKMRGYYRPQTTMLTLVNPEQRVPGQPSLRAALGLSSSRRE